MSSKNFSIYARGLSITYSNVDKQQALGSADLQSRVSCGNGQPEQPLPSASSNSDPVWDSPATVAARLRGLLAGMGKVPLYLAVSQEKHADGSDHFHAGVYLDSKWRIRDPRVLDIKGIHPNLQSSRNFQAWVTYLKKDGNFVEEGVLPSTNKSNKDRLEPSELIAKAKELDQADFLAYCSVHKYTFAKDIWSMVHEDLTLTLKPTDSFEGTIIEEFNSLLGTFEWNKNLTLLLIGESGIGKTTWAKQNIPKPALMVTHIDDLRKFKPGIHKAILFDDVSITHMPETSQIHLLDYDNARSIHCRYGCARIPAGTVKIFTCNTIPVNIHIKAIERRTQLLSCFETDLDRFRPKRLIY